MQVRHIENTRAYGVPVVVAINAFASDTPAELEAVKTAALAAGASAAEICKHHALGGAGAIDLANAVIQACTSKPAFEFLYPLDLPIKDKIEAIAKKVYRAAGGALEPAWCVLGSMASSGWLLTAGH
jgi:formyltetrahydrofolate synthetase